MPCVLIPLVYSKFGSLLYESFLQYFVFYYFYAKSGTTASHLICITNVKPV